MILIVGASASGKTVIAKYLIDTYHFKKFVTSTTRPMRIGEKQNIDYHFLNDEEFDTKIANNDFVEHVTYNGYKYGSERKEIGTNTWSNFSYWHWSPLTKWRTTWRPGPRL